MICHNCGNENKENMKYCVFCGESLIIDDVFYDNEDQAQNNNYKKNQANKSKLIIILSIGIVILLAITAVIWLKFFKPKESEQALALPTYSMTAGSYENAIFVKIYKPTDECTVYYTTDGSTPSKNSKQYYEGDGIYIDKDTTLKSIAIDKTGISSEVSIVEYKIGDVDKKEGVSSNNNLDNSQTTVSSAEYILPESNSRIYSTSEIEALSKKDRCFARNEIYARHGLKFKSSELQNYFNSKSWYHGTKTIENFDTSVFNTFETENINLIKSIEDKYGAY